MCAYTQWEGSVSLQHCNINNHRIFHSQIAAINEGVINMIALILIQKANSDIEVQSRVMQQTASYDRSFAFSRAFQLSIHLAWDCTMNSLNTVHFGTELENMISK